jgi:hypothetical protein
VKRREGFASSWRNGESIKIRYPKVGRTSVLVIGAVHVFVDWDILFVEYNTQGESLFL